MSRKSIYDLSVMFNTMSIRRNRCGDVDLSDMFKEMSINRSILQPNRKMHVRTRSKSHISRSTCVHVVLTDVGYEYPKARVFTNRIEAERFYESQGYCDSALYTSVAFEGNRMAKTLYVAIQPDWMRVDDNTDNTDSIKVFSNFKKAENYTLSFPQKDDEEIFEVYSANKK